MGSSCHQLLRADLNGTPPINAFKSMEHRRNTLLFGTVSAFLLSRLNAIGNATSIGVDRVLATDTRNSVCYGSLLCGYCVVVCTLNSNWHPSVECPDCVLFPVGDGVSEELDLNLLLRVVRTRSGHKQTEWGAGVIRARERGGWAF